jgi:type IV pilus assembly protein PilA
MLLSSSQKLKGFSITELLIVVGVIIVLAGIIVVAVNPNRQFQLARNTARRSDVNSILNAIQSLANDSKGVYPTEVITATTATCIGTGPQCKDLAAILVSSGNYLPEIPKDPSGGSDSDSGYTIQYNETSKRVTIAAPKAEMSQVISVTK